MKLSMERRRSLTDVLIPQGSVPSPFHVIMNKSKDRAKVLYGRTQAFHCFPVCHEEGREP